MKTISRQFSSMMVLIGVSLLTACGGGSNNNGSTPQTVIFTVQATNLTSNQPMSPLAVMAHTVGFQAWNVGDPASIGLENLAESGDNSVLLADSDTAIITTISGSGVFPPGATTSVDVSFEQDQATHLTLAAMPVNTNDGFTGVTGLDVSGLQVGESLSLLTHVYDAGTEADNETLATIPGPAANGEGFNAARDDNPSFVALHSGVVTNEDGLVSSVLDGSHRFDNPPMKLVITRTQ